MELTNGQGGTIINPRCRRSAVLRALHATLAGSGDPGEIRGVEGRDLPDETIPAGNWDAGIDKGENDDGAGFPRTSGVQRNI